MTTYAFVASHRTVDLTTVALLADGASIVPKLLTSPTAQQLGVRGSVVLSTCNRLEIYVHMDVAEHLAPVSTMIYEAIASMADLALNIVETSFDIHRDTDSAHHLFTVASGLESAVVGEREIAGQVRRALTQAQESGTATSELIQLFEHAAHTAKQVGQHTALGAQGRSIVSVALELADAVTEKDWTSRKALIFGTGAYAGATVAALRELGCENIWVYSRSGRAQEFAAKREINAVDDTALYAAMATSDVIIGCSGGSAPLDPSEIPAGRHTILDLALSRDFDPAIADLPEVELITLESVRLVAPTETEEAVHTARTIVESETSAFIAKQKTRSIDSAIVALRSHTMQVLDEELEKARAQYGCGAAAEHLEIAMRRMVKSLLHTPMMRAKQLAALGRTDEYIAALEALYGIDITD